MKKELETWQFAAKRLRQNDSVMLLVVAESTGSSPGRQGFKMAVAVDEITGSIGGGIMEVNLVNQARACLAEFAEGAPAPTGNDAAFLTRQTHQKNSPTASGMICSGKQTVIFRLLGPEDAGTINSIIDALENRTRDILTVTPEKFTVGPPEDGAQNADFTFESASVHRFLFRERLGCKNDLAIVGGGHCALALSELMSKMDFYIRIFDDRPDLNTISKNTFAHEKQVIESYGQIAEKIPGGQNVYVVVMTLGFASDEVVIRSLLEKSFRYFGVLGSRAKMAQLLKNLKKEGYPEERLKTIRTPIGLSINSRNPEEIAVSIAAEIISVKNAG
jgi:xanthine dehydrogenase accessory factor